MKKRLTCGLVSLALLSLPSHAATYVVPTLVVAVLSDDNILISADDRQEDIITRISPGIAAGYESARLLANARYSQDIESYKENPDLDASDMRRFLEASFVYRLNQLMVFSVDADYNESRIPAELNISTGAGEGRVGGERLNINPALSYRFSPTSGAQIDYLHSRDRLLGGVKGDTNALNVEYEHSLSPNTQMHYGYTYTHYAFDNPAVDVEDMMEYVHSPRIGVFHNFSQFSNLTAQVGPRFTDDEVGLSTAIMYQRRYSKGRFMLGYDRGAASLIGEPGLVEQSVFNASVTHEFTNNFEVNIVSSYGEVERDASGLSDAKIARASLTASYRVNDYASVSATYSYSRQETSVLEGGNIIPRNVAMLAFTLTYPRRSEPVVFTR
ncbi:MAG: hypothetical protein Q7W55_02190 [Pseudohongiella sp.]|nr:hypothetical protein [Pseudohongiella sp.]MDO9518766.1 hypothetical protein [Pseudohongiella sp.]MDP2128937.1 hypothetical protein [Pseudohongiella sp.]